MRRKRYLFACGAILCSALVFAMVAGIRSFRRAAAANGPDLSIVLRPGPVQPDGTVSVTVVLSNSGDADATGVHFEVTFPDTVTSLVPPDMTNLPPGFLPWTCSASGAVMTCDIADPFPFNNGYSAAPTAVFHMPPSIQQVCAVITLNETDVDTSNNSTCADVVLDPALYTATPTPTNTGTPTPTLTATRTATSTASPTPTGTRTHAVMTIDADPSQPGVQTSRSIPAGVPFHVRVAVTSLDSGYSYAAYQVRLGYDDTVLRPVGIPTDWSDPPTSSTGGNLSVLSGGGCSPGQNSLQYAGFLYMGCYGATGTSALDDLVDLMFTCLGPGTIALTPNFEPAIGTMLTDASANAIPLSISPVTIDCQPFAGPTATPTNTPPPAATATGIATATACPVCLTHIAVDADPGMSGVQSSFYATVGQPFHVRVNLTSLANQQAFESYQVNINYDPALLTVAGIPGSWSDPPTSSTGGNLVQVPPPSQCAGPTEGDPPPQPDQLYAGCVLSASTTQAQELIDVMFTCNKEGSTSLHLEPSNDVLGTNLGDPNANTVTATLSDATIDCGADPPSVGGFAQAVDIATLPPASGGTSHARDITAALLAGVTLVLGMVVYRRRAQK